MQESADISQFVEITIDARFTEDSNCQSSDLEYCYGLIITNNENFKIAYLITTITSQGMEVENHLDYVLDPYESNIFEVYYNKELGDQTVESKIDAISLN